MRQTDGHDEGNRHFFVAMGTRLKLLDNLHLCAMKEFYHLIMTE